MSDDENGGGEMTDGADQGKSQAPAVVPIEQIRERVKKRRNAEASPKTDQIAAPDPAGLVDSQFISACLRANELGDGALYAAVNRGKFIHCKSSGQWFRWIGHSWELDIMDGALAAVENVVDRLLDEADLLGRQARDAIKIEDNKTAFWGRVSGWPTMKTVAK